MKQAELVLDCRNQLGEGILWHEGEERLYWTDIQERLLYRWDPETPGAETFPMPERLCSLAFRKDGGLLLALERGIALYDPASGKLEPLVSVRTSGDPVRLNDGRCDRQGRFLVGEFDREGKSRGKAYRIDPEGSCTELFGGLSSANSTCFSPRGDRLYYSCAEQRQIWSFDYDRERGIPSKRQLFHDFSDQPGLPDGSVTDSQGFLWNAQWGGGRIVRFSPDGLVDQVVELPVKNVTSLCFGGKDLKTLFITTAREGLGSRELSGAPHSGSLFRVRTETAGLRESRFAG